MNPRPRLLVASLVLAAAAVLPSSDAQACGGCFHEATQTQTTVVTGHRMAFAISPTHTVLWDQIKYSGSPSEFAWVLPVKGAAQIQLSNDAWFETLEAATATQIVSPPQNCGYPGGYGSSGGCGIGCGASAESAAFGGAGGGGTSAPPPVTVTHEGTVGPYETVTLHANVPNALPAWLSAHNYAIDPSVAPIIDAYTKEGFDFIALRLLPGQGIQQMKPVRVVTPGMSPTLPLRMVAAGTGASVAITLFVIGEGRWEAQNFPNGAVDPGKLTWDFNTQSSDYGTQRVALLATNGGRTWNNAFAHQGSLLSQDVINGQATSITVAGSAYPTLGSAYVAQGVADGEGGVFDNACVSAFQSYATSTAKVSGDCLGQSAGGGPDGGTDAGGDDGGGDGGVADGGSDSGAPDAGGGPCAVPAGELDASLLACGTLDDIAVALVGMHPQDVWLTRLEAALPRAALATDLNVQASASQSEISNVLTLTKSKNDPCAPTGGLAAGGQSQARAIFVRNRLAIFATILAAVAATVARRRRNVPALVGVRAR